MRRTMILLSTLAIAVAACMAAPAVGWAQDSTAPASSTWYLAEGSSAWGFSTTISIVNTNNARLHAQVTYMTNEGEVDGGTFSLAPESQTVLDPALTLGQVDFSTRVVCLEGSGIAVDRTMRWSSYQEPFPPYVETGDPEASVVEPGPESMWEEGHASIGLAQPATRWYFPEGCSAFGFSTWLLVQNPNAAQARCSITYMTEDAGPVSVVKNVAGKTRASFNMLDDVGPRNASIMLSSDLPVIPERSVYLADKRAGSDSIGATEPSRDFYLAEGSTGWGFTTYLLIQNPGATPASVQVTCQTPEGAEALPPLAIPARSRKTMRVNDVLPERDMSFKVHGSVPIVAERAMYWETASGTACHDSIGVSAPHMNWFLPEGSSWDGIAWVLVENPNGSPVRIEIATYSTEPSSCIAWTDTIAAHSRKSINVGERFGGYGSASVSVSSMNRGRGIIVERSMYYYAMTGGTNTIGAWSY